MQKDELKKMDFCRWEEWGQKPHSETEEASKNDWGWLLKDLRWLVGFLEKGNARIYGRMDRPSYRDARTHLKMIGGGC